MNDGSSTPIEAQEQQITQGSEQAHQIVANPGRQNKLVAYGLSLREGKSPPIGVLNFKDIPITDEEKSSFFGKLRSGQFYRKHQDELLSSIRDPQRRKDYADQLELLKKESGVSPDVFENGNTLGDPTLKGPWKRTG